MSDIAPAAPPLPVAIRPDEIGLRGMPPSMAIMLNESLYQRVKAISAVMSRAKGFTPAHLIDRGEACFSVITMAMDWKLSWHFVARHTYQTPGGSIGYDGALVQSILDQSGKFIGSPSFEYRGDWSVLNGKFMMKTGQRGGEYPVASWTDADAIGLGVIVRWTVRGESVPRVWPGENEPFWLVQCHPRNSPLWATDPKTQIRYLAIRRFANMTSPGILGGASFDHDELMEAADLARDITPDEPRREDFVGNGPMPPPISDVEPELFEVTALDGEVFGFETPDGALDALRTVLEGARRGGPKMLEAAHENNQPLIDQLSAAGVAGVAELLHDYTPPPSAGGPPPASASRPAPPPERENPASSPEAPPAASTAAPPGAPPASASPTPPASASPSAPERPLSTPAGAPAGSVVGDGRFPGDLPPGQRLGQPAPAAAPEPRPDPTPPAAARPATPQSSPPAGPGNLGAASRSEPAAAPAGDRPSLLITPPLSRGRPDYRTLVRALLIPKIRQQTTGGGLAFLLGDNEANIDAARDALDRQDLAELDAVIDAAWARLRP